MDSYSFYKSLYDRELDRRNQLDSAINIPISVLTILGTFFFFLVQKIYHTLNFFTFNIYTFLMYGLIVLTFFSISASIYWLLGAFNNYFKGFEYENFGSIRGYRRIEVEKLPNSNKKNNTNYTFESIIIDKLSSYSDRNKKMNLKRGIYLYKSKKWLIYSLISIFLILIIFTLKILLP